MDRRNGVTWCNARIDRRRRLEKQIWNEDHGTDDWSYNSGRLDLDDLRTKLGNGEIICDLQRDLKENFQLMVGRFLSGFSGLYGILLPLYVGEIASKEIRGGLLSFFQIILSCGEVFVFAVGHYASYLVLNIVCGIIPIIYFITFLLLPESPVFLVRLQNNLMM